MAQGKRRKHSSATSPTETLGQKSAEELAALLAEPSRLTPYLNQYVEENAAFAEKQALERTMQLRRQLLCDLANTKPATDGMRWFRERWKGTLRPEAEADLVEMGEKLRYLWGRPGIHLAERVLNTWLTERPAQGGAAARHLPFSCSLGAGRLVPDGKDVRAMLIQGIFENWRHLSHCANAVCVAPYFIAKRKDQLVCDAEICKAEKQRAHALKWWHENRGSKAGPRGAR